MNKSNFILEKPADDPNYKIGFMCFFLLQSCFYKIDLQIERIEKAKKELVLPVLFADIHFFLVSVSNLKKILEKLKKIYPADTRLKSVYKKHQSHLYKLTVFRHHLEHIDHNRLEGKDGKGKPLKDPDMLGNLVNDTYNFGGDSFDLAESFSLVTDLEEDINNWNLDTRKIPWDKSMLD